MSREHGRTARPPVGRRDHPLEAQAERVADDLTRDAPTLANATPVGSTRGPTTLDPFLAALGSGRPLDSSARGYFQPRLGRDLGDVRLHTGPAAIAATGAIGAAAFTSGSHIVLGEGAGGPAAAGRRVLAHELAHVVQQVDRGQSRELQRVGMYDESPPEVLEAERAQQERARQEELAREARHQRWEQSHRKGHTHFLRTQAPTTLAEDIAASRSQIIEQRVAMIREAAARPPDPVDPFAAMVHRMPGPGPRPFRGPREPVPAELAEGWALGQMQLVLVESLLPGGQFTSEAAAVSRAVLANYYALMLPLADYEDQSEAALQQMSESLAAGAGRSQPCPNCHSAAPSRTPMYTAPPPRGPTLRGRIDRLREAVTDEQWRESVRDFERSTTVMDAIVLSRLPEKSHAAQAFSFVSGLLSRQEELQRSAPDALRIPAVFYPEDTFVTPEETTKDTPVEVASGIPWYFYLTQTPTPHRYAYPPGFSWVLKDITSPKRPQVSYEPGGVERFLRMGVVPNILPPPALFKKLNDKLVFPTGMLYWTNPDGTEGELRTTEPKSLSDWLGYIGIGLAGLAIILATGGLATPGVLAGLGVAAAAAGIGSTLADLQERSELGILTEKDKNRAMLSIAADIASVLSLGLGRVAAAVTRGAIAAGRVTSLTLLVRRSAAIASAADRLLGGAVLITVSADLIQGFQAIRDSNLPPAEKDAAMRRLALTGLLTGGMALAGHGPRRSGADAPGAGGAGHTVEIVSVTRAGGGVDVAAPPARATSFLDWSRRQPTLAPDQAAHELQLALREGTRQPRPDEPNVISEIHYNEHKWIERPGGGWCRYSVKRCYLPGELRVGARGDAERVSPMTTTEEIARFRERDLARRPSTVRSKQARRDWDDYTFYAERRLRMIETALAKGGTPAPPPRTFSSFQQKHPPGSGVRSEIQGTRFEARTRAVFAKELGPERADLVLSQYNVSASETPTRGVGELTRPDFLFPSSQPPGWTAACNKSRTSFDGMTTAAVESQVVHNLVEAVEKYAGTRHVRRTGKQVDVTRIWVLYDAAAMEKSHRRVIETTVATYQRVYRDDHPGSTLTFDVGIF